MFFKAPGKPTPLKKTIYLCAAAILGLLLGFIAYALVEINYLRLVFKQGLIVSFYGACALPPLYLFSFIALGLVGGYLLGRYWWRLIYIERFWEKRHPFRK